MRQLPQMAVQLGKPLCAHVMPSQAVTSGVDSLYVFVIKTNSAVCTRELQVGVNTNDYRVATNGPVAGEQGIAIGRVLRRDKTQVPLSAAVSASSHQV